MIRKVKRSITIRDVADLVGVHHSTVSRALSPEQKSKISPAVVRKIEKAVVKLGYQPNMAAAALKHNRSFAVGILIPDLMNPVFPPIIRGVQNTLEQKGYAVITTSTDDDLAKEWDALRMMRGRSIEGLIIATARREDPIVDECIDKEIPFVLVNRTVNREGVNAIINDEDFGMKLSLEHLISLGHSRIAHVAGSIATSTGHERMESFKNHMQLNGLKADLIVKTEKYTIEEGKRAFTKLQKMDNSFTAIIAGNDLIALGCIDAMNEAGIRVPEDVSIVGGNDIPLLSRMTPALTTVNILKYEMGAQAANTLLDIILGTSSEPVTVRLQPKLVERSSTAKVGR